MTVVFTRLLHLFLVGLALSTAFVAIPTARAQASVRERLALDLNWRFQPGDAPDAGSMFEYAELPRLDKMEKGADAREGELEARRIDVVAANLGSGLAWVQPDFDDSEWRKVQVPHDWAVELPFDEKADPAGGHRLMGPEQGGGIGWYRRAFDVPASDAARSLALEFDGVFRNCVVWLNGVCLGRHVGGYTGFRFDVGHHVNVGGRNVLVVRVDASRKEGWWYEGAGIYRHTWLVKTSPVHVAPGGVFVQPTLDGSTADVKVTTVLRNLSNAMVRVRLDTSVIDMDGETLATSVARRIDVPAGGTRRIRRTLEVKEPRLWKLDDPYRYRVVSSVVGVANAFDTQVTAFGVRSAEFDPAKGFVLNGERVELRGVLLPQEHAGVGVALPDALMRWRLEQIRAMGANAIRTAYGPVAPEVLDACDELGILVVDEQRRIGAASGRRAELEALITRDRNHPSVIAWSLGSNEFAVQGEDSFARHVVEPLRRLAKKLDPSRPVTLPMNWNWGRGASGAVDVMGFSYRGNGVRGRRLADDRQPGGFMDIDQFHAAFPKLPAFGAEEGGGLATRGEYEVDGARGFFTAYDRDLAPWGDFTDLIHGNWGSTVGGWTVFYRERPWLGGVFIDAAFDRRGHPAPLEWPVVTTQSGVMDLCGFPKDAFAFHQAAWSFSPVVHILPHWNWSGREGREIEVVVFSNLSEIELLHNGRSLGREMLNGELSHSWTVRYEPGVLEARGFTDGKLATSDRVETTDSPYRLVLTPDRTELAADGIEVAIVTVTAVDRKGRVVPTAGNLVHFEITTPGRVIGVGNGDPSSHEPDQAMRRRLFNGRAQLILQSTEVADPITLSASSAGLVPATLVIETRRVDTSQSLR